MSFGASEAERLHDSTWPKLTPEQQIAAAQGIGLRIESGEYADPHWVPSLATYLHEKRWERPLRPKPRPGKLTKSERGMQDFRRLIDEEATERGISMPGLDPLLELQRRRT